MDGRGRTLSESVASLRKWHLRQDVVGRSRLGGAGRDGCFRQWGQYVQSPETGRRGEGAAAQENGAESKEMSKDLKGGRGEKGCMKIWEESSRKRAKVLRQEYARCVCRTVRKVAGLE